MSLSKYFPTPSDRMGFLWTLTSIKDVFVIEFGPAGTTHFAIEGVMELNGEHKMNVYTTHMSEVDITFGKHDKLAGAIREVDTIHHPKYIFVMASSISSLIGIDIESICFEMKEEIGAKLIPVSYGGYDGDYTLGVERGLLCLCENIVKKNEPEEQLYNIIGCNIDSYNFLSDKTEIESILSGAFGLRLNTCFTAYTSVDEIEQAAKAKYNIVLRHEGLKCAEYMKKKFSIPYVYKKPYGASMTLTWLKEIAEVFELNINMPFVKEKTEGIQEHISHYKTYLRSVQNKDVIIYGEYDTALGMRDLLKELGLSCNTVFVKHKISGTELPNFVKQKPTEGELAEVLSKDYYAAFGDDTLRKLCESKTNSNEAFFQIANPNMDQYNFYQYMPLVGLNGTVRILQDLMNFERKKKNR